jgi:hypothetical protein
LPVFPGVAGDAPDIDWKFFTANPQMLSLAFGFANAPRDGL